VILTDSWIFVKILEPNCLPRLSNCKIEKTAVQLLFFLFIQFSNIEIRSVFSHAKLLISWLKWLEKNLGCPSSLVSYSHFQLTEPGAIIGDGDRKRAPFQVLGLSPWYGTIILFLEQIARSPAAHARTCCEDFCGCRAGEMASEIPEIFHVFGPQLNAFTSVGILLN